MKSDYFVHAGTIAVFLGAIFYVTTVSIYYVNVSAPLMSWLPLGYWVIVGLALTLVARIVISETTTKTDYLAVAALQVVLFVGPTLMESSVRYNDSYSLLFPINYLLYPDIYRQTSYSGLSYLNNWPGYFYLVSAFYEVLGLGYYLGIKVVYALGEIIILILSFGLGSAIFKTQRASILFGLITIAVGWDIFTHPSPVLLGEILLLTALLIITNIHHKKPALIVFGLAYAALVISYGLTTLLLVAILLVTLIATRISIRFVKPTGTTSHYHAPVLSSPKIRIATAWLLLIALTMFCMWFLVEPSAISKSNLLSAIISIFSIGTAPISGTLGSVTPFRLPSVLSSLLFVAILGMWGSALFLTQKWNGRKIDIQSVLILITIFIVLYLFPPTATTTYDHLFENGFPFLAVFFTSALTGMKAKWRIVQAVFIILLVLVGFLAFYAHEPVYILPQSEVYGSTFVLSYAPNLTPITYASTGPLIQALADAPRAPITIYQYQALGPTNSSLFDALNSSGIIVNSTVVQNSLLYYYGSNPLNVYLEIHRLNVVYDSTMYSVFETIAQSNQP